MSWFIIFGLAIIIFFNRYFFLEPAVSIKIPDFLERMLKYAAPSLLTAICIPIIFFDGQYILKEMPNNPYLYAAIFSIFISLLTRHIFVSLILSLIFFYILIYLLT